MEQKETTVLYIGGWGRSGSTILGQILGQIDKFSFVGELPDIWKVGVLENRYCACGKRFRECDFWVAVFNRAYGGIDNIDAEMMIHYWRNSIRNRYIPFMLLPSTRKHLLQRVEPYQQNVRQLYMAIQEITECNVIVDSSKWPAYSRLLAGMSELDIYFIHLIRDARAVAYSWQRRQLQQPGTDEPMPREPFGWLNSTKQWIVGNWASEMFWKRQSSYMQIRYEDFVTQPMLYIEKILRLLNLTQQELPFTQDDTVILRPSHAMWGNPARFEIGKVKLRIDNEWIYKMDEKYKWLIASLTAPLLYKYGYLT